MIRTSYLRPVAVAMAYMAVAILGVRAAVNIPVELYPNVQLPRLTVTGSWPGASPETVEAFLTSPIEAAIQLVEGVETVTSTSTERSARIQASFALGTDMNFARLDLSERLANLEETVLPYGTRVTVTPYVPDEFRTNSAGILTYTFTGALTLEALREHVDDVVVPELSRVEGVSVVNVYGGRQRMLEAELDREAMAAMRVSATQVGAALGDLDLVAEAGAVRSGDQERTVTIRNRPETAQEIGNTIIRSDRNRIVRIKDVAIVRDTWEDIRRHDRVNSRPAVRIEVQKEIGANTVWVADMVKERLVAVEVRNPPNTRFILTGDESAEIRREMSDMQSRVFISMMVIFGVLLIFLRSIRPAVMVFATIAFSVLIALNFIYFAGFSLNLITLMGLAMGFGLVVDNSIVVLENIYRRWQQGDSRAEATQRGASNVVLPIFAATGTNIIVLVPFVYLQDELRVYYLPLAIAVGLSLIASLLVAFTFIPALAGKILPQRSKDAGGATAHARMPVYQRFYRGLVTGTLRWPWLTLSIPVVAFCLTGYLFLEHVNRGYVFGRGGSQETYISISIRLPEGTDIERTDEFTRFFEDRLRTMPEVGRFVTRVLEYSSNIHVTFPREIEHTHIPVQIKDQLFAYSLGFSGVEVIVTGIGPSFYGGGGSGSSPNYRIQVLGYNYEEVRRIAEDIGRRVERRPRVRNVNTNAGIGWGQYESASEFGVHIRREALASYDLTVSDLVREVGAAVRGQVGQNMIKIGGDEVRYQVKVEGNRQVDLVELAERLVVTSSGEPVRLGNMVEIIPREILATILRENQQYHRVVGYEFRGPPKLGDVVHETIINTTQVPPGYTVKKSDYRWSRQEESQIYLVLGAAIILVYMLTAALFESLLLPLCVIVTVPMALIGVFLIFFYTEATFSREAYIGVIMMGGIVVNNAILLVDHINRLRWDERLALKPAVVRGTVERVRPILMTTVTTIVGLLPLVLFSETVNSNIWNALAFVLIGGLASSSILVLTVTPALYYLFERVRAQHAEAAAATA